MLQVIEVAKDVVAAVWAARLPGEVIENKILSRLLQIATSKAGQTVRQPQPSLQIIERPLERTEEKLCSEGEMPDSKKWTDVLVWTLQQLGGTAELSDIYRVSRLGRERLGVSITRQHDASARECLESHCSDSLKYRDKIDLFCMPAGKGAGIWALR